MRKPLASYPTTCDACNSTGLQRFKINSRVEEHWCVNCQGTGNEQEGERQARDDERRGI